MVFVQSGGGASPWLPCAQVLVSSQPRPLSWAFLEYPEYLLPHGCPCHTLPGQLPKFLEPVSSFSLPRKVARSLGGPLGSNYLLCT